MSILRERTVINMFLKFDTFHEEYKSFLYDNGTILKIPKKKSEYGNYITFGCSKLFDSGIHSVTINKLDLDNFYSYGMYS